MTSSVVQLDVTLRDFRCQNQDWTNFNTLSPQNFVQHWQIFMDDFHI